MIKVLNQTHNVIEEKFNSRCKCGAELEYVTSDRVADENRNMGVKCPVCGKFVVDTYKNPFQYPDAFYNMGSNAKELSDEEVQQLINQCLKNLDKSRDWDYIYNLTGNTGVFTFYNGEETEVFVCKNYAVAYDYM